jgi:hypothetical protein
MRVAYPPANRVRLIYGKWGRSVNITSVGKAIELAAFRKKSVKYQIVITH